MDVVASDLEQPLVLFDGTCGMCSRGVRFVLDRDPAGVFHFAALQSRLGQNLQRAYGVADIDSMVVIEGDRAWLRSSAVLRVARRLPWPWCWAYIFVLVPAPVRDLLYRLMAATRRRWAPPGTCRLLTPVERGRFLDE